MRKVLHGPAAPGIGSVRLWDLDWLRVAAILGIFVYHVGRLFDDMEPWHVKYHELTGWLTYPMALGAQFMMPLFWVLSGMGTWFALGTRPAGEFLRLRAARLLVPVVTVGWWLSGPVQVYIESTTDQGYNAPEFRGTLWEFLPHYVTNGLYGFGGFFPLTGLHLWYLTYLFLFTAASLPLFLWLRTAGGERALGRLAALLCRPGAPYLLAVPVLVVEAFLPREVPVLAWEEGGWLLGSHWVFLVLGFVLVSDPRLRPAIRGHRWPSLLLAATTTVPLALLAPGIDAMEFGAADFTGVICLRSVNGWLWLMAILGFGMNLNRPAPILGYLGPAVLPFYILHQPLIIVLGYLLRDWQAPIPVTYALVTVVVLAISLLMYEFAIRRFSGLRVLFGMSRRSFPPTQPPNELRRSPSASS
ncbi:MAG TPA: acyltransferase family protein [Propionicimonas sp.]